MEADARADFEGNSAAMVGALANDDRSPVSFDEVERAGYVSQEQLANWIEDHLIPKLQTLTERMDAFELDLGAHKQRSEDQHATAMATPSEYVETLNRFGEKQADEHRALNERLDAIEERLGSLEGGA